MEFVLFIILLMTWVYVAELAQKIRKQNRLLERIQARTGLSEADLVADFIKAQVGVLPDKELVKLIRKDLYVSRKEAKSLLAGLKK